MKDLQHLVLRFAIKIDQHVSANDQIEARKGRVAQDIMRGKKYQLPEIFPDPVSVALFDKKAFEPLGAYIRFDRFGITVVPRLGDRIVIHIGREDLYLRRVRKPRGMFAEG